MSVLDKASLIQIPSGYKNGKLYSVKPTPTYGSELVTNGDFSSDSDWTKGTGVTIANGVATSDGSGSNYGNIVTQDTNVSFANKKVKINFDVLNYVSGKMRVSPGNSTVTSHVEANGSYEFIVDVGVGNDIIYFINYQTPFNGSIDNVSVKEITNIGDFTFSRSSSATRVNSEGLIETASVLGTTELVTNGDFASSSNWNGVNANGVTISNGTLNYSETPNGTNITQSSVVEIGKRYKVTFTISNYVKGGILVVLGAGGTTQEVSSNGTFNLYGVASINTTLYIQARGASGTTLSIDNVSVKEVIENDVPRLDYSDGSCASLLLEGQRTNLVTYSEDYSQNYWRKDKLTATANSATSPSGLTDAFLIQETTYTNSIPSFDLQNTNTLSVGTYTFSFYVKNNNGRYLGISFGSSGERVRTNFDFNTNTFKTLNLSGSATGSASYTTLGDYYRISISATFPSSVAADIVLMPLATDTYPFFAFQDSDNRSFYLWGIQVEQSSYATSYIPTSGSTVTRTADVCNNAGTSATFNSTEGVLFFEAAALADDLTNRGFALSDGTSSNACRIYYANSTNNIRFLFNVGGSAQVIKSINLTDITDYNKIAFSYKQDDFKIYINGVKVEEDTSGSVPSANTFSKLSFDRGYGGENFYGKCKQLIVFNEALSDSELTTLTTL
jgi:hypothetical protein